MHPTDYHEYWKERRQELRQKVYPCPTCGTSNRPPVKFCTECKEPNPYYKDRR